MGQVGGGEEAARGCPGGRAQRGGEDGGPTSYKVRKPLDDVHVLDAGLA